MRVGVLTISSSRARAGGPDASGDALEALARSLGGELAARDVVPDQRSLIEQRLRQWADGGLCELVLTTGGTGLAPSDVTPEATRAVIEREAPGIAEAMRLASRAHTPHWMLSRGVAGVRGGTLIINFPGSPRSIAQAGESISGALAHAVALLSGGPVDHAGGSG